MFAVANAICTCGARYTLARTIYTYGVRYALRALWQAELAGRQDNLAASKVSYYACL